MIKSIILFSVISLLFSCGVDYKTTAGLVTKEDRDRAFKESWTKLQKGMDPWQVAKLNLIGYNGTKIVLGSSFAEVGRYENLFGDNFMSGEVSQMYYEGLPACRITQNGHNIEVFQGHFVPGLIEKGMCARVKCPNGITLDFANNKLVSWRLE